MTVEKKSVISIWNAKTVFLIAVFLVIFGALGAFLGYVGSLVSPDIQWWHGTLLLFAIAAIVILISMSSTKNDVHKNAEMIRQNGQNEKLKAMVEELAAKAGINTPAVVVLANKVPNAYTCGTPEESYIVVHDSLLRMLDDEEMKGVLAHEVSHVKNNDIPTTILATRLGNVTSAFSKYLGVGLLVTGVTMMGAIGAAGSSRNNDSAASMILLAVAVLGMVLAAIGAVLCIFYPLAYIVKMAISRDREYEADKSAAMLTGNPMGLANALYKLKFDRYPPQPSEAAYADLMIVNNAVQKNFVENLLNTHPPLESRIKRLEAMAGSSQLHSGTVPAPRTNPADVPPMTAGIGAPEPRLVHEEEPFNVWETEEVKRQVREKCTRHYIDYESTIKSQVNSGTMRNGLRELERTHDPSLSNVISLMYFFGTNICPQDYALAKKYRVRDNDAHLDELELALAYGTGTGERFDAKKAMYHLKKYSTDGTISFEITYQGEVIFQ